MTLSTLTEAPSATVPNESRQGAALVRSTINNPSS